MDMQEFPLKPGASTPILMPGVISDGIVNGECTRGTRQSGHEINPTAPDGPTGIIS